MRAVALSFYIFERCFMYNRKNLNMNVLIMQSYRGRDEDELLEEKKMIIEELKRQYGTTIQIVDQHKDEVILGQPRHFNLILNMLNADEVDMVAFGPKWEDSTECEIMHHFCKAYAIHVWCSHL